MTYRVAIVGRPNVGKSTLFNRLSRSRRALVGDEPGMTRDRIFADVEVLGKRFELVDTGGIIPGEKEAIPEKVFEQAAVAIEQADLILLVVDARAGVHPLDREISALLNRRGKDFVVAANKVDVPEVESDALQFYALGADPVFSISAEHNLGIDDLLDYIVADLPESPAAIAQDEIRVAVIGRPNVGKSSLVNRLAREERVIVSSTPGTTRDAVDTLLEYQGRAFRIIDTAGIRRKGRPAMKAERLSVVMARRHLERADVVILLIDAEEGATHLDATIGGYAEKAGKSVVVAVNKWDLIEKETETARRLELEFRGRMRFLDFAPMVFVSALTGQRIFKLLEAAQAAFESRRIRVPTAELNRFLQQEVAGLLQTKARTRKPAFKYATQVGANPPTFVLFLRGGRPLHFSRLRFLVNRIREKFGFYATPIRILQRTGRKA
ncbi:MAG TPA: ribosome biogenesis GTPase Der [Acidobacteriota bacterium]|nr:ribosome biogenesis GTPase Der [Acidobacteriota bacterium]